MDLLQIVQDHMRATRIPETRLGRLAAGDKRLVEDLRNGRRPGPALAQRVREYCTANPAPYTGAGPRLWNAALDDRLWSMLCEGIPHRQAAEDLGFSLSAVQNRARLLGKQRAPSQYESRTRVKDRLDGYAGAGSPSLLRRIDAYLIAHAMTESRFGREVSGDPRLVSDMRAGRAVSRRIEARISRFIRTGQPERRRFYERTVWTPALDAELVRLIETGLPMPAVAAKLGTRLAPTRCRAYAIADQLYPDRPHGLRLSILFASPPMSPGAISLPHRDK